LMKLSVHPDTANKIATTPIIFVNLFFIFSVF
jgi:hypothetical protein